jgi:hypothetical protein
MQQVDDLVPWARAVVRDGRITLNAWSPGLMSGGPTRAVLRRLLRRGVMLADLSAHAADDGREELIVRWIPDGRTCAPARAALLQWAELVGYRRVWLPQEVVDFSEALLPGGRAATSCPTCGAVWDDETPEFWAMVRGQGHFPGHCPICNGSLPEWVPAAGGPGGARAAARLSESAGHGRLRRG